MTVMTKVKGMAVAAGFAAALLTGSATMAFAGEVTLTMAVPDWPPTRIMKKMFDEQYKSKTGNTVKLEVDFIPWPDFYTRVNASLTSAQAHSRQRQISRPRSNSPVTLDGPILDNYSINPGASLFDRQPLHFSTAFYNGRHSFDWQRNWLQIWP